MKKKLRRPQKGQKPVPAKPSAPTQLIEDNRLEAVAQRKMQQMVSNSPQVTQMQAQQSVIDSSNATPIQRMLRRLVGGVTSGLSKAPSLTSVPRRYAWTKATDKDAESHFGKHGSEFGHSSVSDYHNTASTFTQSPPSGTQQKVGKDGKNYFYHAPSNTFAVTTKKGEIATMFQPDPAKHKYTDNQAYFDSK